MRPITNAIPLIPKEQLHSSFYTKGPGDLGKRKDSGYFRSAWPWSLIDFASKQVAPSILAPNLFGGKLSCYVFVLLVSVLFYFCQFIVFENYHFRLPDERTIILLIFVVGRRILNQ